MDPAGETPKCRPPQGLLFSPRNALEGGERIVTEAPLFGGNMTPVS